MDMHILLISLNYISGFKSRTLSKLHRKPKKYIIATISKVHWNSGEPITRVICENANEYLKKQLKRGSEREWDHNITNHRAHTARELHSGACQTHHYEPCPSDFACGKNTIRKILGILRPWYCHEEQHNDTRNNKRNSKTPMGNK